jgi:sulfatase maturation enzyme AslB (radical SAM superfamily)
MNACCGDYPAREMYHVEEYRAEATETCREATYHAAAMGKCRAERYHAGKSHAENYRRAAARYHARCCRYTGRPSKLSAFLRS